MTFGPERKYVVTLTDGEVKRFIEFEESYSKRCDFSKLDYNDPETLLSFEFTYVFDEPGGKYPQKWSLISVEKGQKQGYYYFNKASGYMQEFAAYSSDPTYLRAKALRWMDPYHDRSEDLGWIKKKTELKEITEQIDSDFNERINNDVNSGKISMIEYLRTMPEISNEEMRQELEKRGWTKERCFAEDHFDVDEKWLREVFDEREPENRQSAHFRFAGGADELQPEEEPEEEIE